MEVHSCLKIQDLSSWLKAAGKALPMNIMVHTASVLTCGISGKKQHWKLAIQNKKLQEGKNNVTKLFCTPGNGLLRYSHGAVCCT